MDLTDTVKLTDVTADLPGFKRGPSVAVGRLRP